MSAMQMGLSNSSTGTTPEMEISSIDTLQRTFTKFVFSHEGECTFEAWFRKYEDLLEKDAIKLDEAAMHPGAYETCQLHFP